MVECPYPTRRRLPIFERVPYAIPQARNLLAGFTQAIFNRTRSPVAFFAYPDQPSTMLPEACTIDTLATPAEDILGALQALADELNAPLEAGPLHAALRPPLPSGELKPEKVWATLAALLPEEAIIADESVTASFGASKSIAGRSRRPMIG